MIETTVTPDRWTGDTAPDWYRPVDAADTRPVAPTTPDRSDPTTEHPTIDLPEPTVLRKGLTGALWIMSGVATWMAASGQLGFADWAGIKGPNRYGVPAILELFAVILLLLGYRHGRRKRTPYPLWALACLVGGFATYTNIHHAGHRAGLVYGAASAAALLAWLVKLRLDLTYYLVSIRHIPPARPKLGRLLLVAPRLAHRSWVIAIRRRIQTTDEAVTLAEVWMAVYRDFTEAGVDKRLAKRTAWRSVYEMSGGPLIELPRAAEIATVAVTVRPPSEEAPDTPTTVALDAEATDPTADTPTDPTTETPDHPTGAEPTPRPALRPTPRSHRRPVARQEASMRIIWSPIIRANAALIRERFADRPDPTSVRQVRSELGWSADRAKAAFKAYRDGADLESNDDKEQAS